MRFNRPFFFNFRTPLANCLTRKKDPSYATALINSGEVKLVVWAQASVGSEMMRSCKCFPHVSEMLTLTYNRANSVIINNAIILNSIHNIFNLRDTEVAICIILVLI